MDKELAHISVCICTYRRPQMLRRLLNELEGQGTGGLFEYSIVVADNDHLRSAESVVLQFTAASPLPVRYCVEPRQSIALARNTAVKNAAGDFVAFIDDDEFPTRTWLMTLYKTCREFAADGVLGPVRPHFDEPPPRWLVKGKFHERKTYRTGSIIDWRKGRTGNLLFRRAILPGDVQPFRAEYLAGEDQDFFRRMIDRGHVFVWCNEAVAYEVIPRSRWKRRFLLRKALFQGASDRRHTDSGTRDIARSMIAVPGYSVALPFALFAGHHRFMRLLVKLCHHVGKLLAAVGIRPIKGAYVTSGDC